MSGMLIVWLIVFLVAVIAFMFAPFVYALHREGKTAKARGEQSRFDERQRLLRCGAAMHALFCVLIFLLIWACLDLSGMYAWTQESFVCAMLAVILAYGVWMGECILRDVAIGWNTKKENKRPQLGVFLPSYLGIWFILYSKHTGMKVIGGAFIVTAVTMVILQGYAEYRQKKAEKVTEDSCEEVEEM